MQQVRSTPIVFGTSRTFTAETVEEVGDIISQYSTWHMGEATSWTAMFDTDGYGPRRRHGSTIGRGTARLMKELRMYASAEGPGITSQIILTGTTDADMAD